MTISLGLTVLIAGIASCVSAGVSIGVTYGLLAGRVKNLEDAMKTRASMESVTAVCQRIDDLFVPLGEQLKRIESLLTDRHR